MKTRLTKIIKKLFRNIEPEVKPEINLFDAEYWLGIRKRVPSYNLKKNRCIPYSLCAAVLIDDDTPSNNFEMKLSEDTGVLKDTGFLIHMWLESFQKEKRFVVDGHAGFLDFSYPDGFYGFIENAPEKLRKIYDATSKTSPLYSAFTLQRVCDGYPIN